MTPELRERLAAAIHGTEILPLRPEACAVCVEAINKADALSPLIDAALADAWAEGYEEAVDDYGCDIPFPDRAHRSNPYRTPGGGV